MGLKKPAIVIAEDASIVDSIVAGDVEVYVPSTTNIRFPSNYDRGCFYLKQAKNEKRGVLYWREFANFGDVNPARAALIDWEAQTVELVVSPSGVTNKIYEFMFDGGKCYVANTSGETEDGWPPAMYIPDNK